MQANRLLLALSLAGLVVSFGLFGLSVRFHSTMDPIIRIPFVFGTLVGGLFVGAWSLRLLFLCVRR